MTADNTKGRAMVNAAQNHALRYGTTRVGKILAAYNDLRNAVRTGDMVAANEALDRYEPWADYVFAPPKTAQGVTE